MSESESDALPLGDGAMVREDYRTLDLLVGLGAMVWNGKRPDLSIRPFMFGSPGRIRTSECLSQSQMPYRLATGL